MGGRDDQAVTTAELAEPGCTMALASGAPLGADHGDPGGAGALATVSSPARSVRTPAGFSPGKLCPDYSVKAFS